jgi:hypothetical protein
MIKITAPYQLPVYKILEQRSSRSNSALVKSEPISNSNYYDPTSIPGSSNPVMVEE